MEKLNRQNIENEIAICMQMLANTDYKALKHADGAITDDDYATTKAERQAWRDRINELQKQLETAGDEDMDHE